jgi:hypothetical protein
MFSVSVTVLYWHPKSKIVSNVNKTTGTEEGETTVSLCKTPLSLKYSAIQ